MRQYFFSFFPNFDEFVIHKHLPLPHKITCVVDSNFRLTMNHRILFASAKIIYQNLVAEHASNEFHLQRARILFHNRNVTVQSTTVAARSKA
jgi:hypothetical protein